MQDCLKVIGGALHKVRESVKYVLASETREELFEKCVNAAGINENAGSDLGCADKMELDLLYA